MLTFLNPKKNLNNKSIRSKIWEKNLVSPTTKVKFVNLNVCLAISIGLKN